LARALAPLLPLAALLAVAGWCSRAELDIVAGATTVHRLALLPPLVALVAMFVLMLGALWAWLAVVTHLGRSWGAADFQSAPPRVVAPMYAAGVVILPYLPVVADLVPALRAFAGPLGTALWAVCLSGTAIASLAWAWSHRTASDASARWIRLGPLVVASVAFLFIGAASFRMTLTPILPGGDEPHYLVLAQSLWRDHDLKIENNHDRGDYREYFARDLAPHYLTRGADKEIYSIHPIGLPLLIAPVYALGGYRAVVLALVLVGALAAAAMWRFTRDLTGSAMSATIAWIAVVFSVPFVFNSMSVYPEIVGAGCVLAAFLTGWPRNGDGGDSLARWWVAGVCLASLPWLATKYVFMTAALGLVLAGRAWAIPGRGRWWPPRDGWLPRVAALAVPGLASFVAWLAFFKWIWGAASPAAPYGAMTQTRAPYLITGGPGLIFDQEYGLLAYVPVLVVALWGWWGMLRTGGTRRRLAIESIAVVAALLAAVGAFRIWWGDASPGRPIVAALLLWAIPLACHFADAADRPGRRAWTLTLLAVGCVMTTAALFIEGGLLVASSRDGLSRLLQWLGGSSDLWTLAPSYIAHELPFAIGMSLVWLVLAGVAVWWVDRVSGRGSATRLGPALLRATLAACTLVPLAGTLFPAVIGGALQDPVPAWARSRSPLLDGFSSTARPIAVRYDPISVHPAVDVLSDVRFRASPGEWKDPPPVPLLLNMRLSLPAGRYRVSLRFAPLPLGEHRLGMRIGRTGPLYRVVDVPATGSSWVGEFDVPIDANFVGFEASKDLQPAVQGLEVTPISVLDAGRRTKVGQVLAAREYASASVFSHDERSWLEPRGIWTQGRTSAALTLLPRSSGALRLSLRAPLANRVTLVVGGWRTQLDVQPDQVSTVEVPGLEAGRGTPMRVETREGSVPADRDPTVRDRRFLGVFLEFPEPDGSAGS
jgi:hypothetical protein